MPEALTDDVVVTRPFMGPEWGLYALCYMQVCAYGETPPERVEQRANELNPTGGEAGWRICWGNEPDNDMNDERFAPGRCSDHPDRLHYLLSC